MTSPDVATDGVGGTGTMHASNRLIEASWRTAKIVVKAPENGCSLSRRANPHAMLKIAGLLARRPHLTL
jgi:cysteine synthase